MYDLQYPSGHKHGDDLFWADVVGQRNWRGQNVSAGAAESDRGRAVSRGAEESGGGRCERVVGRGKISGADGQSGAQCKVEDDSVCGFSRTWLGVSRSLQPRPEGKLAGQGRAAHRG